MSHPVLRNSNALTIYAALWTMVIVVHFVVLYFFYGLSFLFSLADSAVYNAVFGILGIPLWYVIRYSTPGRQNRWQMVFNHLTSASLLIALWIGISYGILSFTFRNSAGLVAFLQDSIVYQVIIGIFYYSLLSLGYNLLLVYKDLEDRVKEEARLTELLKESELNMLKSQINPHFLFNSLNSVSSLTITDPPSAQEMVIRLSEFLRYTVSTDIHKFVPLGQELENIQRYLQIEKVRFGPKLDFTHDIQDACATVKIPAMLLQPLFENAIKHGVYESTGVIHLVATCKEEGEYLVFTLTNNFDPEAPSRKGTGTGLKNIKERMRLIYHQSNLVKTYIEHSVFHVELRIPLRTNVV
jgi:sensor histidine kinase YesM